MRSSLVADPEKIMDAKGVVSFFGAMWTRAYDQQFVRTRAHYIAARKLIGIKLGELDQHLHAYLADPGGSFCRHSFFFFLSNYNNYAKKRKMKGDPYAQD